MTKYILTCQYCGHRWEQSYYFESGEDKCEICHDTNIKVKEVDIKDYYGYDD